MGSETNISTDSLIKIGSFVVAIVVQAFVIYNTLLGKIDEVNQENIVLKERIVQVEKEQLSRSRYIEMAEDLRQRIQDLEQQAVELSYQDLNLFKRLSEIDNTMRKHIEVINGTSK